MLTATCHCGAVRIEVPRRPRTISDCNCSICRRYGVLWAYYATGKVRVRAARTATRAYVWGDTTIRFIRCDTCGCVTHYVPVRRTASGRMAVNARMFDLAIIANARIRRFDGAETWKYLD